MVSCVYFDPYFYLWVQVDFRRYSSEFPCVEMPNMMDFLSMVLKLSGRTSSVGLDGVPYAAWAADPVASANTFFAIFVNMTGVGTIPQSLNHSFMVFPPKKSCDRDSDEVRRKASECRPISLRNADAKTISAVVDESIARKVRTWARPQQRGFIAGRNFLSNIVDIDYLARAVSYDDDNQEAGIALLDFGNAFARLSQDYIEATCRAIGMPRWFMNFLKCLFSENCVFRKSPEGIRFLFQISSGVLQGDPFSATLFVIALDPFLGLLADKISNRSVITSSSDELPAVRGCADDLALVLTSFKQFSVARVCFEWFENVSSLQLKFPKCTVVPISLNRDSSLIEAWRERLRAWAPSWANMAIKFSALYLGIFVGPGAYGHQFSAAASKWTLRAREVAKVGAGIHFAVHMYQTRALPCLAYVMQLFPVPKAIIQRERHLLHTVAHLPPCSFPTAAFRSLASVGLPSFRLLQPLSEAIRWRTATSTIRDSWQVHHYRLTAIRRNKGPFCNLVSTESSDVGWLGPAIVDLLHDSEQTGIVARGGRVDERSRQQDVAYKFACERLPFSTGCNFYCGGFRDTSE